MKAQMWLSIFAAAQVPGAWAGFIDERALNFSVRMDRVMSGDIQISASALASPQEFGGSWSPEVDPKNMLKSDIGKILAVKAAYVVNKGIGEINEPGLFDTDHLSELMPDLEVIQPGASGHCIVQRELPATPFGLLPSHLRCTLDLEHSPHPMHTGLDAGIGEPSAVTRQGCVEFNTTFHASSSVSRYYPLDRSHTLIVTYQTYLLHDSAVSKARWVPGLNLRKELVKQIKGELTSFIKRLNERSPK